MCFHFGLRYFNSEEIGRKLGHQIRSLFVPPEEKKTESGMQIECPKSNRLVPIFEEPLSTYCTLPGGVHYLYICKPGKQIPLAIKVANKNYVSKHILKNSKLKCELFKYEFD